MTEFSMAWPAIFLIGVFDGNASGFIRFSAKVGKLAGAEFQLCLTNQASEGLLAGKKPPLPLLASTAFKKAAKEDLSGSKQTDLDL